LEKHLLLPSKKESLSKLELFLDSFFNEARLKRENFFNVLLSLSELVNNSISHGNQYNEEKKVVISCSWLKDILTLTVEDEGSGFNLTDIKDPTLPENINHETGRGLFLTSRLADNFDVKEKGRIIEIKFEVEREYQFF